MGNTKDSASWFEEFYNGDIPSDSLSAVCMDIRGRKNRYGHPHDLTLKRLEKSGAKIYSTQDNGAVAVTVRKKTMWIHGGNS